MDALFAYIGGIFTFILVIFFYKLCQAVKIAMLADGELHLSKDTVFLVEFYDSKDNLLLSTKGSASSLEDFTELSSGINQLPCSMKVTNPNTKASITVGLELDVIVPEQLDQPSKLNPIMDTLLKSVTY